MDAKKFMDLHVHIGPEMIPRKYTVRSLVAEERGRISGMALKSHFTPTMPLIMQEDAGGLALIGSVTLNNCIGGLNPDAVYASAKISDRPIIVWFPTISAANSLKQSRFEIPPEWAGEGFKSRSSGAVKGIGILNRDRKGICGPAKDVLKAIKDNGCVLATGHISWQESKALVEEAVSMGIENTIVTHPIYQFIRMPIGVQKKLAGMKGVYIEHNYAMHSIDGIPVSGIADQIKEVGAEKCIISSDVGQPGSPSPSEALLLFSGLLIKEGIREDDVRKMAERNPRKILGI